MRYSIPHLVLDEGDPEGGKATRGASEGGGDSGAANHLGVVHGVDVEHGAGVEAIPEGEGKDGM